MQAGLVLQTGIVAWIIRLESFKTNYYHHPDISKLNYIAR